MKYNRLQTIEHDLSIVNILVDKQPLIPRAGAQTEHEDAT